MRRSTQWMIALSVLTLLLATPVVLWAQSQPQEAAAKKDEAIAAVASAPDSQQQAMKDDLQKMQVILNQMRTNLAFVGSTTTPLNHQFELEIGMWQLLIDQMKRRVDTKMR